MPWEETHPLDQRLQFVAAHQRGLYAMTELCARYAVSRKTGYKWLVRYAEAGPAGLHDRSHAPHTCPHAITPRVAALLVAARRAHPTWGPAKLLHYLAPRHPKVAVWPAVSTVADLLTREGLVTRRRRRRPAVHPGAVPIQTAAPNDLWTADFKGQFRTRDAIYCYPLTIADQHTRYLLTVHALLNTRVVGARAAFERAFRTYGLPQAIRTDNGVPFANTGLHGLTQLSVWWLRLGIQHQRIRPASPQENGAHERMHRTLKAETTRPPERTRAAQHRRFQHFLRFYNEERPHAALGGATPASQYAPSERPYPDRLPALEYPGHYVVKRVTNAGTIRFQDRLLFLANALKQHHVGLEESADGVWSLYLGRVLLGRIDERTMKVYG
ncbi:MAG: Mobile element protein [uncultured Gemmatimonadaceae bacterium]|uniref:Mobile element protein n=2 Tax=Bacteria TaxID=2 RepID=A0A6J4MG28_9BACT|nr:MAG: Mobile element protein [uncultured Gemmatimonadaceae bacterium]CAA9462983.1 MAG: Mobile element protein [uncultured Solirubrobacteraceae bacterium]